MQMYYSFYCAEQIGKEISAKCKGFAKKMVNKWQKCHFWLNYSFKYCGIHLDPQSYCEV